MAMKLSTTLSHITTVPNSINSKVISEFYHYMKSIGTSENYQNQNLKAIIVYAKFLGPEIIFYDIQKREQIVTFLDTKIKNNDIDPDKKWITTWNDYLWRIKYFLRWFHNQKLIKDRGAEPLLPSDWITPLFATIKKRKTKRFSH
ncbi:MAG: hypothetical protein M3222_00165 [Thermoproteota archaeon]|nr:hypothetical protein [Thermoproteota archaeon]